MPSNDDIEKSKAGALLMCGKCKGQPPLEVSHTFEYVRCPYCKQDLSYSWSRTECTECGEIGMYHSDERNVLGKHILDEWECDQDKKKNQGLDTRNSDEIELEALGEYIMATDQDMSLFIKENLSEESFKKWLELNPN